MALKTRDKTISEHGLQQRRHFVRMCEVRGGWDLHKFNNLYSKSRRSMMMFMRNLLANRAIGVNLRFVTKDDFILK